MYFSPSKRSNIYHRIICGLSCSDILASFAYFFGTWLVPANKVGGFGSVYGAIGNDATCSLSGFFAQFAVASTLYNGTLTWFYLLTIYFSWSDRNLRKIEKWFHIIPIGFALLTSSIAAGLDMYGNVEWLCWIKPDTSDGEEPTAAQKNFVFFQWMFLVGPLWVTMVFVSRGFFLLHRKMRENERKMEKYKFSTKSIRAKLDVGGLKAADRIKDAGYSNTDRWSKLGSKSAVISIPKPCAKDNEGWRALRSQFIEVSNPKPSGSAQDGEGCRNERIKSMVVSRKEREFRAVESPKEVAGALATRAALCELGGVENGLHTEPKAIMRDYEYDEEAHPRVMLINEKTAEQKGCQDVDREEDTMLKMEEERLIEQVAISTPNVQSVGTQNDALDSDRMSRNVRCSMIVDNIVEHQCPDETLKGTHDLDYVDVPIHSGNSGLRQKRRTTFRDSLAKWSFLSTAPSLEINDVADTTELISSSLKRKKKLFNNASKSRQIAIQGMLYVCAFYITWLFPTIQRIMELSGSEQHFIVQLFVTFLLPLQGLLNFAIYIRPRFMALKKNSPDIGFWSALWKVSYEI